MFVTLLLSFILVICLSLPGHNYNAQDKDEYVDTIDELRIDLGQEFDDYKPLLPKIVRLVAHDCFGPIESGDNTDTNSICNGCINFDNGNNDGLAYAVQALEGIYSAYKDKMSRADFYAAAGINPKTATPYISIFSSTHCHIKSNMKTNSHYFYSRPLLKGTIALEYAQKLDTKNNDKLPEIPYYFGRKDCDHSPYGVEMKRLPSAFRGWDETYKYMQDNCGMDERETIAILGAHTLGHAHEYYSGFGTKSWVMDPYALNNYYYTSMVYDPWYQIKVNCDGTSRYTSQIGCKYEWHDGSQKYMMLNSDICIFWDIHPDQDGKVYCDSDSCPQQSDYIKSITLSFADDNQLWLDAFVDAWKILVTTGYDRDELKEYYV